MLLIKYKLSILTELWAELWQNTVTTLLGLGILQWFIQMFKSYRLNNYFCWWNTEDERKFIVAALNTIQYCNIDLWEVTYFRVYNPCEGCTWRSNQVKSNRSFLTVLVLIPQLGIWSTRFCYDVSYISTLLKTSGNPITWVHEDWNVKVASGN